MPQSEQHLIKTLENTIKRLREERQYKRDIINAIHDGIIVFSPDFSPRTINTIAQNILHLDAHAPSFFRQVNFYKNKKSTLKFKLKPWLEHTAKLGNDKPREQLVWFKHNNEPKMTPLLISAKPIFNEERVLQSVLLVIYDRRLKVASDEKQRILNAAFNSFDGQFLTNDKGYLTHPNFAFSAYTGLMPEELKTMTIINWLQKQVLLKIPVEQLLRTLLEDGKWSGEVEVHPNSDTVFYAVLSLSMITDDARNIECYVGTLQDITDIKEAQAEVEHLAYYDELTELPNRRLLLEHLEHSILHHSRNKTFSALLYLDLDRFKSTNDAFGHAVGDELLKFTAERLKEVLRAEDTVARMGGDEFVILTHLNAANPEIAYQQSLTLSSKVIQALNTDYKIHEHLIRNAVSVGVCVYPVKPTDQPDNIITYADLAMYEAKHQGRNRVFFYENALSEEMMARHQLEEALNQAEIEHEFELYFQPQFNLNEELVSAETLIRWHHPRLGFISPSKFIPIAEDGRQILKIGDWILKEAFKTANQWHQQYGLKNLSINISPIQFHETSFVQNVENLQREIGVPPDIITMELTEGILISDMDQALEKIHALSVQGYQFSIDDFGTGYSSLSYFQKLPIHELKIDQSFVFRLPNQEDVAIIETILSLGDSKQLRLVAEGIETPEQVDFFKQKSPHVLLQGYYFSAPLSQADFEAAFLRPKTIV